MLPLPALRAANSLSRIATLSLMQGTGATGAEGEDEGAGGLGF